MYGHVEDTAYLGSVRAVSNVGIAVRPMDMGTRADFTLFP